MTSAEFINNECLFDYTRKRNLFRPKSELIYYLGPESPSKRDRIFQFSNCNQFLQIVVLKSETPRGRIYFDSIFIR